MHKIERLDAVLQHRRPDRTPVSFWYHFGPGRASGTAAVEAHVGHMERFDLDFLKIMDDNRYPRIGLPGGVVASTDGLEALPVLGGDEGSFARQLELVARLAGRFRGECRMMTTVFNSWTVLRQLAAPESALHRPPVLRAAADPRDALLGTFLREAPGALSRALDTISLSTANFVRRCLDAGADGIFLSVRDDWVDRPENGEGVYDRLVRPGDLRILSAAREGACNMLHVCGRAVDFGRFARYPVHAINWADRSAGPSIASVAGWLQPAICGGLDNLATMATGSPEDCRREAADAVSASGGRPIILAPGCTFDPAAVPEENLLAIRRFAGQGAGHATSM